MPPQVLVLSASVGAGHLRAAEAVALALKQRHPHVVVENHDVLTFTNKLFQRIYSKTYLELVDHAPHLLGYLYDWLDQPSRSGGGRRDRFRFALQKLNLRTFVKFLTGRPWDLIINTHFLSTELIASLKRKRVISAPQATVVTDFEVHRLWRHQPCEKFFCAIDDAAAQLRARGGVADDQIAVTGIPIHPAFAEPPDRGAIRDRFGLPSDRPIALQLAGGFGVGPVEEIARATLECQTPIHLVVACGRNQEVKNRLARIKPPARHGLQPIGYTTEMHLWMAAADLVISKPGGLTTSETLARGLPMLIVNPIPGQESRNSDFLLENGAAIKVNDPVLIPLKLDRLFGRPDRLATLRANARALSRPRAAFDVAEQSLALIGAATPT